MARTTPVNTRLPNPDLETIDALVATGRVASRSAFIIQAVHDALADERERQIAETYRRALGDHTQLADDETWVLDAARESLRHDR